METWIANLEPTFLAEVRFARPWFLGFLLWPITWVAFQWRSRIISRQRRQLLGLFASPRGSNGRILWFLAGVLLVIGIAEPRWGKSTEGGVAVGRDVIVLIDLSRSMLAEDLSTSKPRWKAAVEATTELVEAARVRGGHRIGIVIFAARPKVLVPLTTDYEHCLQMLGEIDGNSMPLDLRPDDTTLSGTRIGAALKLAVSEHDQRFPGVQDLILLSDGDDPEDDKEFLMGIPPARSAKIPIHVVGIGNTESSMLILKKKGDPDGEFISTALREDVLKPIAEESRGTYIPAGRNPAPLGTFFRDKIEPLASREFADDDVIQKKNRSAWFFCFALLFLGFALGRAPL